MALSQDLINQFVKLTNKEEKPKEVTVNGTYKMINGEEYVQIDGSEIWTPVTSTVEAETGERVKVMIKNHTATVTGNISSPSARSKSVKDLKDEVDEQGNTIKQLDNSIEQQGNSIIQIDNNIKQVNNNILQANNAINQQGNIIKQLGNEINQQGDIIDSMNNDITMHSNEITQINNTIVEQNNTITQHGNTITQQGNIITQQGNEISQHGNKIDQLDNNINQQGNAITQINNKIVQQDNVIQQQGNIIDQQDNVITEHGNNITILNSGFSIIDGVLVGLNQAIIDELKTKHLDAEYATIDFSNINTAAVTKLFTESGIIKDLIVKEGKITGELVGVTIKGDLIEGNTIAAEKLVVKGSDGLYYKLNIDGLNNISTDQASKFVLLDTKPEDWESNYKDYYLISDNNYIHITGNQAPTWKSNTYYKLSSTYESGLDGSNIVAKSITADKVSVTDLVAFGATIGGFNISQHSIYSGGKSSVDNVSPGFYMDDKGQITFGDNKNFIKFFKDKDNQFKLRISANEIYTESNSKSIAEQMEELDESQQTVKKNSVTNIEQQYAENQSTITAPTDGYSTTKPNKRAGYYIWQKTITTYGDNHTVESTPVCISGLDGANGTNGKDGKDGATGAKGDKGDKGDQGVKGDTGNGVKSAATTYQAASNGTTIPTGTWSTSVPKTTAALPYLWSRTITTYTDNSTSTAYAVGSTPEGIVVGSTQLLRGTKDLSGATIKRTIAEDTFNGFTYIDYEVKSNTSYVDILAWDSVFEPEKEQTYTLSFWAKGTGTITSYFYPNCVKEGYNSDGQKTNSQDGAIKFNLTSEWKRHWVTWTTLSNVSGLKNIIVARFNNKAIGQICVAAPKFELGNKATDWSPAPEDMNDTITSVVNLYYSSNSSTLPAKPTTHVTTNNTTIHNAWNISLPTYDEQYPYLYTCKEVLNKGDTYSWTTVNQTTYSEAIKTIQTELDAVQADYLKESTFSTYKREQIENDQGIKQRLSKTELTVYGDPENPDDPKALINHIQKVDNDINGSGGLDDRLGIAEGTIEGTGLNEYDQRVKITQRFLNVETDVESIKNIFNITGGTNLIQNSVGYFASNNKPSMWDIASNTIYTPFGYDGDLTGVTVSRGKLFCAKGSITTTTNNIIALLSNKMVSISFKYKNGANATSKIKIFNGSIIYFEKAFNTTVNQWTEYRFDPDIDPILANPTFLNTSNSLQISIESTNSTDNNGFEISDLMLNYGNVKPWELYSNEVYGAMVKLSSLGIEVTATTANTKNFMTTDGILVYRYDSKTDKIIGTEPITKITDNGTITNKLESTGDIIERNLIQTVIKDSSNKDIYVEYIR